MFERLFLSAVFCCLAICLSAVSGFSQDLDNVTISGKVTDSNDAPIVGASVTARRIETGVERAVTTNEDGFYRLVELEPGTYTVKFSAGGFGTKEQTNLVTVSGQNVQLNISLAPASVTAEQTITIDGDDAPAVDTTRTIVGGTVQQREIEELPNLSRNPLDLIFTLGGTAEEPLSTRDLAQDRGARGETAGSAYNTIEEAGVFSLSGGAATSNNITIDGLDNNDDRAATFRFQPSLDAIAEVQVVTNQFSAEYGRASGGRVNFRTRSGGKNLRGRASYFFRDDAFNANTWRNNARGILRPSMQEHIPVFSLGGPIPFGYFKKRTFFFGAYEYQNLKEDTVVDTYLPVAQNSRFVLPSPTDTSGQINVGTTAAPIFVAPYLETVPTPLRNHTFSGRIDHNFTDNHSIAFNAQYGKRRDFRQFSGGSRLAEALIGSSRETQAYSLTDNYVFSPSVVNQARFQYSTLTPQVVSDTNLTAPVLLIGVPALLDRGTTTIIAGSSTTGSSDRLENRWQFQETLTWLIGAHSFKLGADVQNVNTSYIDRGDATGTFNFFSVADFLNTNIGRYRHNFGTTSTQKNTYFGVFAQDDWRLASNFVLSMGLRYERETIIDDDNNLGPRLGMAWSPFKDNKGVIRFGAGIFYNRALLRTIDDYSLTTNTLVFDTNNIPAGATRNAVLQNLNQRFPQILTIDEARSLCTANNLACGNTAFGRILDPNLVLPESYQFNVGFEREISKSLVFEANYTWNKSVHLWREFNSNAISLTKLNSVTGGNYSSLAAYLLATSFNNTAVNGVRPIYATASAKNVVRFVTEFTPPPVGSPLRCSGTIVPTNSEQGGCARVNGVETTFLNLNSQTSINTSPPIAAAYAALQQFRPDPTRTQLEQLASIGNSQYQGLILELRRRYRDLGYGFGSSFRIAYTLSSTKDDGSFNTSSAQIVGDFRSEWARSLQDRRHRLAVSGVIDVPKWAGRLRFSPIFRIASGAPFNLSAGGVDRNLDDVNTDRPDFSGNPDAITFRNPYEPFPQALFDLVTRPTIGTAGGTLGRNSGRGPAYYIFDLSVSRQFNFGDRFKLRPTAEFNNVLNARVFSYGTGFINSTDPQTTFLVPTRTYRPREIRLGVRFDF